MLEYLTLGEFAVALLMSLAALMAFIWASASGAFTGIEAAKHQVLRVEGIASASAGPSVPATAPGGGQAGDVATGTAPAPGPAEQPWQFLTPPRGDGGAR
jgi:cbb3-type cytochrome oxidase maturation protein